MQKITPFLWFDDQAEEAMNFYVSIFKNSNVLSVQRYGAEGAAASGRPKGSVMTASFLLDGQEFVALNGGPVYKITSRHLLRRELRDAGRDRRNVEWTQRWRRGSPVRLADRQVRCVVADRAHCMEQLLGDPDPVKAGRVMQAMLQMKKIDIAALRQAYAQR